MADRKKRAHKKKIGSVLFYLVLFVWLVGFLFGSVFIQNQNLFHQNDLRYGIFSVADKK